MKKVFVFDLDGTLCSQESFGSYEFAKPKDEMIRFARKCKDEGDVVVIHTARGMRTFNGNIRLIEAQLRPLTEKWLKDNNVPYDELIFGKPSGDFYIDDKCLIIPTAF